MRAKSKKDPFRSLTSEPEFGDKPYYYQEGILHVQHFMNQNFMQLVAQESQKELLYTEFIFQRFPHPSFVNDDFVSAMADQFTFVIMLCFMYLGQHAAKSVALEKESRLKAWMPQ
jgi:hypothetical protein